VIEPSTQSGSTTNNFCVGTTTTMAKKTKTKTPSPSTAQKRKTTGATATTASTAAKKTMKTAAASANNNKKTKTKTPSPSPSTVQKRKATGATTTTASTSAKKTKTKTKKKTPSKGSTTSTKKKKKGLTNKQVTNAKNQVVLGLEKKLLPKKEEKRLYFTEEEDRMMTKAFVNITQDEEVGAGQKGEAFWTRVKEKFDLLCTSNMCTREWPWKSIQSRFQKTIAVECMVFVSFLQKAKEINVSGWSIELYIEAANLLFIEQHEKSFKRKKCMAILVALPKYSMDPITVVDENDEEDGGMVVGGENPIMAVQGANKKRPMGRKKAKKMNRNSTPKSTSESSRMLDALEQKNVLNETIHLHRSYQQQATFYLKMGNKKKAQQYMTLLEADQLKRASIPTTVDINSSSDDNSAGSGGNKTNDSRFSLDSEDEENDNEDKEDDDGDEDGDDNNDDDNVDVIVVNEDDAIVDEVVAVVLVDGVSSGDDDDTTTDRDSVDNDEHDHNHNDSEMNHNNSNKQLDCDISPPN